MIHLENVFYNFTNTRDEHIFLRIHRDILLHNQNILISTQDWFDFKGHIENFIYYLNKNIKRDNRPDLALREWTQCKHALMLLRHKTRNGTLLIYEGGTYGVRHTPIQHLVGLFVHHYYLPELIARLL